VTNYKNTRVNEVAVILLDRLASLEDKPSILRAVELKALYAEIPLLPDSEKGLFGKEINALKMHLAELVAAHKDDAEKLPPIDVTAPIDINVQTDKTPKLLSSQFGSQHPLVSEIQHVCEIFYSMGFNVEMSRQIDDDYHMFDSLNFPKDHPARDDYDTFMTTEGFVAPAHTSTMQNRMLKKYKNNLAKNKPVAVMIVDRVFRNEDLDARHEHTFYQAEGVYVDKGVNVGNLLATLKTFLGRYYHQDIEIKTQPSYFPFTEPSFEIALSCPFCKKEGCNICSYSGWIELMGCGLIHPNVLKMAGIDPVEYTGFAWGGGIERLVMMKYDIEDIRYFEAGKLEFLRQFK
jgi:phenylalanyl-tRNA synthetase alpha chain